MLKRLLKLVVLPLVLLAGLLVLVANLVADPAGSLPPPDPAAPITLPDGRVESLAEVLARRGRRHAAPRQVSPGQPGGSAAPGQDDATVAEESSGPPVHWPPPPDPDDVFSLARAALEEGRDDEALALFLSVPADDPRHADAQRRIGWDLLTERMDRPAAGLAYVNAALAESPFDGNAWQDTSRVYLRTLGVDWDPVQQPPEDLLGALHDR